MNRKKSIFKILSYFISGAVIISLFVLFFNFLGFAFLQTDLTNGKSSPEYLSKQISQNLAWSEQTQDYVLEGMDQILKEQGIWLVLLDPDGKMLWQRNKPGEIPIAYSHTDIARMTRWFLNDYPVYLNLRDDGILIMGMPKDSYGKYFMSFSSSWFRSLPQRMILVLALNALLAALLAGILSLFILRSLRALINGISSLTKEKAIYLPQKGIFRELAENINEVSRILEKKNNALKKRDTARSNWIRGISHDIRTPLSMILGYSEEIASSSTLPEDEKRKAKIISAQSIKIKNLVADMNLVSTLEYEMQPAAKENFLPAPLLRETVCEMLNNNLPDHIICWGKIEEGCIVCGDKPLLKRAFFNLIHNAVVHNPQGCTVTISQTIKENQSCCISISDNGKGTLLFPQSPSAGFPSSFEDGHGLGLVIVQKIIAAHGGMLFLESHPGEGFSATIQLPLADP